MTPTRRTFIAGTLVAATLANGTARAEDAEVIEARVNLALGKMYAQVPGSRELATRAKAILVMPDVIKGGFIVGGSYGEGALRINDPQIGYEKTGGYYSIGAASVGFQAGLQQTSHALFFLTDDALERFQRADGWQVGVDAEVAFPDKGLNFGTDSTTAQKPVIAIVFGGDGLLLGASLEGAKYSRILR
ncbi:MAG: YSC84-related protein [Pseudomonadota bacterium]